MSDTSYRELAWPDGLDEAAFRRDYWQQRPLLLRQVLPGFESPIDADELAGLAIEDDSAPRIIERIGGDFRLEHGPFEPERFARLPERDWSLLVTDVDKQLPEMLDWIAPFTRIAPAWRFDDLMISYAPDGASVGAHVDEYDVFLLQASGQRRWSIDARPGIAHLQSAAGDLRLVEVFEPTDSWVLDPGDALYLPPGFAHHGVALGDGCTTWSIGFRAPSHGEIVMAIAELIAERLDSVSPPVRLRDAGRGRSDDIIDDETIDAVRTLWATACVCDRATIAAAIAPLLAGD